MRESLILRPAEPEDTPQAAALFYSTGPPAFNLAFGSQDKAISIIRRLFARPGNPMSFEHTTVAEVRERVVGILTISDRAIEAKTQPRMGAELLSICGPAPLLSRLPVLLRLQRLTRLTREDELCIDDIAVSPQVRGKGIGRLLMQQAERLARRKSYTLISLYVLRDNFQAIGFYHRLGYVCDEERTDCWLAKRYGFRGFLRMVKPTEQVADKFQ